MNRGQLFRYEGFTAEGDSGLLSCRYSLDGREFTERVTLAPGPRWSTEAARAAARLVYLLAGVSYYKTAAPPVIDFGDAALTAGELAFLREYYVQGLGEFAYNNKLDLSGADLGESDPQVPLGGSDPPQTPPAHGGAARPLVPPGPFPPGPGDPGRSYRSGAGSTRSSRWSRCGGARTWPCSW